MASGRYYHVVRTDTLEHWILLELLIAAGRKVLVVRMGTPHRPDGFLGSDFVELESAQNIP